MTNKNIISFLFFIFLSSIIRAEIITFDSHIDIPFDFMENSKHDPGDNSDMQVDIPKMQKGGMDAGFFVVYVPQGPLNEAGFKNAKKLAEKKFKAIVNMTRSYSSKITLALSPKDIYRAKENNLLSAAIGIENGYTIGEDISLLDYYYSLGARYMTLAHIGHNQISDSSIPSKRLNNSEKMHNGISSFGRKVIKRMNNIGMMVDISHISEEAAFEAIQLSRSPVIASHSCAKSIADHPRNLSDDLILALASKGGVIQVVAFPNYVKVDNSRFFSIMELGKEVAKIYGDRNFIPSMHAIKDEYTEGIKEINKRYPLPSVDDLIDHIDYIVELVGIDYVGISSDFGGGGILEGWIDASQTNFVTERLRKRGYSENDIKKIWGENILRVWREVEDISNLN
ncbi:MAG: membrane dipeptidase [Rhodobiaceae bacterium]|nr:membrane dipeptidase [Rhodobiaceae bacterium]